MARPKHGPPDPASQPWLSIIKPKQFVRDVERMKKRGEDMGKFMDVLTSLSSRHPLAPALKDHPLKGDWRGWRDCHVGPDWVLIYRTTDTELVLARTGTHSDLFKK